MRHHRTITVLAIALLGLAACGDDDDTAPVAADAETSTTVAAPVAAVEDGVLAIEVSGFTFGALPDSVPAGTKLAIENAASTELHELVALRIADTEERSVDELIALPEAELLAAAGPIPTTVLLAAPGEPQIAALGDGTLAEPGRYLVLCAIPTGADPAEYLAAAAEATGAPDVPGGPPHFSHGMYAELLVE